MGLLDKVFKLFSQKQKHEHYTQIANGTKKVKDTSKYSEAEQIAYARGQRDARNEQRRIYAYNNATPLEREAYKNKRKEEKLKYKANKKNKN